jgi:hypothetical protein
MAEELLGEDVSVLACFRMVLSGNSSAIAYVRAGTTEQLAEKLRILGETVGKLTSGPEGRTDSCAFIAGDKSPACVKADFFCKSTQLVC